MGDKRRKANADWLALQTEYVTKNVTLAELARAHDISYNTLIHHSSKEKWSEKRQEYHKIIVSKTANRISNDVARHYKRIIKASDALIARIEEAVSDKDQSYLWDDKDGDDKKRDRVNTAFLSEIAHLLAESLRLQNEIHGVLPESEWQHIETERRKIEALSTAKNESVDNLGAGGVIVLPQINKADDGV